MMDILYVLLADAALPPDYFFETAGPDYFLWGLLYFLVIAPVIIAATVVASVLYSKRRRRNAEQKKP